MSAARPHKLRDVCGPLIDLPKFVSHVWAIPLCRVQRNMMTFILLVVVHLAVLMAFSFALLLAR